MFVFFGVIEVVRVMGVGFWWILFMVVIFEFLGLFILGYMFIVVVLIDMMVMVGFIGGGGFGVFV